MSTCSKGRASARTGILLIHGLTGTPNRCGCWRVACTCRATVYAVKLAGHCGTLDDLVGTSWLDWLASVRRGADLLSRRPRGGRRPVDGRRAGAGPGAGASREHRRRAGAVAGVPPRRLEHAALYHWPACCPSCARWASGAACSWNNRPTASGRALRARVVSQMRRRQRRLGLPGNPWWSVVEMHKLARSVLRNMPALRAPCLVMRAQRRHRLGVERLRDPAAGRQRARHAATGRQLSHDHHRPRASVVIARAAAFVTELVEGAPGAARCGMRQ